MSLLTNETELSPVGDAGRTVENWRFLFTAFQGTVEFETAGGAVEKYSWFHSGGAVILVPMRIWH